ncbi:unnamed protein product [Bursaphelenchus okinawaensis]|uniref:ZP domain-containing protein n=1 Tax=Bursaphelenchus okinawaensis TaxID=465554 RepID=A0A811K1P7_9BILA|nr:unnamed protein product [Bursaphelenchus okinawaensis]CAG9089938.1 unnamed protein product [Bursaphelenchus okinawaensis]
MFILCILLLFVQVLTVSTSDSYNEKDFERQKVVGYKIKCDIDQSLVKTAEITGEMTNWGLWPSHNPCIAHPTKPVQQLAHVHNNQFILTCYFKKSDFGYFSNKFYITIKHKCTNRHTPTELILQVPFYNEVLSANNKRQFFPSIELYQF